MSRLQLVLSLYGCLYLMVTINAQGSYQSQCTSENDYGWPRFHSRDELEADTKWAYYFQKVYGELPADYPVCVFDFWHINKDAYDAAGLTGTRPIVWNSHAVKEGDLYLQLGDYGIYHSEWKPVPNNTWVDVAHAVYPTELKGAWVWTVRGSGIWYNTGRTIVFPTPADLKKTHAEAIAFLSAGCSVDISNKWPQLESDIFGLCAREKGYNTVQFRPQEGQLPIGTFNQTGLTEMVLVDIDGDKGCGVINASNTPLRSGWRAAHQCDCK